MASTASATPDTLVTVKVNIEGTTRRCKLPLRDMGASTLEDKLRTFLSIPPGAECLFERYSDSAASYVVLDPNNVSVYKQLYRAAKAKQKLKLRATLKEPEKQVPKPVSIEDVPEPSEASSSRTQEKQPVLEPVSVEPLVESLKRTTLTAKLATTLAEDESPEEARFRYNMASWRQDAHEAREICDARVRLSNLLNELQDGPSVRGAGLRDNWRPRTARSDAPASSEVSAQSPVSTACPATGATFAVCCNSCDKTIPDSHYHCSTCDDGDFDLCEGCVQQGITCYGDDHWLIKRAVKDGQIHSSTTERIPPKPKAKPTVESLAIQEDRFDRVALPLFSSIRTCNCCVAELPEQQFLHCTTCEDYDLCKSCFAKNAHGHHPRHGFVPVVEGTPLPENVTLKLAPGRHQIHNAICDGCEKFIAGVRHKCLDCPDWDYCGDCVVNANFIHPNHRFVPVYEPLSEPSIRAGSRPIHYSIRCDGPLCRSKEGYISGIRYKCAVCHDTDFCANCEASPALTHNKTHPLIKFKTPVRHVSVTTTGERDDGHKMPLMGDRRTVRSRPSTNSEISVNTVVDVKPEPEPAVIKVEPVEAKTELEEAQPEVEQVKEPEAESTEAMQELSAVYVRDTVTDGTVLPPNHNFQQTWILRNTGNVNWPAGCSVRFVGGDYMGHVDSNHPAGISELVSASESTRCYSTLAPGQEFPFTVLLRTPSREGKIISYWRLTTADGFKFGHRLWCDVNVQSPKVEEPKPEFKEVPKVEPKNEEIKEEATEETQTSQMIFPKLEKESPVQSVHEDAKPEVEVGHAETRPDDEPTAEGYEDCEDDEWEGSEDGFMTDEEYDILDASDEEYLDQQSKSVKK